MIYYSRVSKANEGVTIFYAWDRLNYTGDNEGFKSAVLKKIWSTLLNKLKWWHYCENVNMVRHVFLAWCD